MCMCLAAFRSGAVMGFLLASLGLLVIYITIQIFFLVHALPCRLTPPGHAGFGA